MKTLRLIARACGLLSFVMLTAFTLGVDLPFINPEIISVLMGTGIGGGVFQLAVGAPIGSIDTQTTGDDRLERDVSSQIVEQRPEHYRLDSALRKLKSTPLQAKYAEWEEVGQHPRIATIDSDPAITTGAEITIPFVNAGEAKYFIVGDTARVHDTATNTTHANFAGIMLFVSSVDYVANTINVRAYNTTGFVNVPAVPLNATVQLIRSGHANSEKQGVGSPRAMEPVQLKNGIHTFEKYVSQSKLRKKLKTFTPNDMKRAIRQAIYDFRLDMESTFWDGVGMEDVHPDNLENMFTMKGFSSFVTTNTIALPAVGSITEDAFLDWAEQVSADSNGSETKLFWVSNSLWTEINKINLVKDTLRTQRRERVLGGYINRIETGHCELMIGVHKGFSELGKTRFGAIIDPMHLRKRVVEPMQKIKIDPEGSGGKREEGVKWIETCTVEYRYEKTHAILT